MHMWKREYKYLYTIKNMYNGNILYPVGSSCITKFDRKDYGIFAKAYITSSL